MANYDVYRDVYRDQPSGCVTEACGPKVPEPPLGLETTRSTVVWRYAVPNAHHEHRASVLKCIDCLHDVGADYPDDRLEHWIVHVGGTYLKHDFAGPDIGMQRSRVLQVQPELHIRGYSGASCGRDTHHLVSRAE